MLSVVLVMAGSATRMKNNENKVFLPLKDKMVFQYSLDLFLSLGYEVVCVIKPEDENKLSKYSQVKITYGGKTRQESVYNGLRLVTNDKVLIHDAARPFITKDIIIKCDNELKMNDAVLVGIPMKDSIYSNNPLKSLKRDDFISAQTPQGGKTKTLLECHLKAIEEKQNFTDDISLILNYSNDMVKIIEGIDTNFKITTQLDYIKL